VFPYVQAANSNNLPVIRWGMFRNYQPVFIGVSKGFFKEAGVHVDMVGAFTSGPSIVQAVGIGQLDAGHSATTGLINAAAQGIKVVGVADSQTEFKTAPLQQWFVLEKSSIKKISELKGKRIGTNSLSGSFHYTMLLALQRHGLTKDDVQFVILPHERHEQALRSGLIDVAGIIDPYSVAITAGGGVRLIFSGADILGERQISLVFFAKKVIDETPEIVRRFLIGYRKSIEYLQANPFAGNTIMAKELGLDNNLVIQHRYTENAKVIMDDADFWLRTMRSNGELTKTPNIRTTDFVTDRFNN